MSTPLADWPRPCTSGPVAGTRFYFTWSMVLRPAGLEISRGKYRCDGVPDGVDVMSYGPSSNPDVVDSFREGYLWEELMRANPSLAAEVGGQVECLVIQSQSRSGPTLNYFRNVIGLITWLLDCGGVAVYDPQMFKWWNPADWRAQAFEPASASPRQHVVILFSDDEDLTEWFHTHGMRKFGRPDLSVHRVTRETFREPVIDLCNRFIE